MNYKKSQFNFKFKITSLVLIQTMLFSPLAWAKVDRLCNPQRDTLSPQINMNNGLLQESILNFISIDNQNKNIESIENIAGSLKDLGFKYADKFSPDFSVSKKDKNGQARILLVTADGENAFILRETLETGLGKGSVQRRVNLIELNPFTPNTGFEHENGFCRFQIHKIDNTASLGANQEVIIRTDLYQGNGLASAMLSLAIATAKDLGAKKISVYNVVDSAVSLYEKLGFVTSGRKTMILDLEKTPVKNSKGAGSWYLPDVAKNRGFQFAQLNPEQSDDDIRRIKDEIFHNKLIQNFFKLDVNRGIPWSYLLYEIFEEDPQLVKKVISLVQAKGEAWIAEQGEIIRETHSSRSSYPGADTGGSWDSFINKNSGIDTYNLSHLLAHSIGFVKNYIDMSEKKRAEKFLEQGYIILQSIKIESRQNEQPDKSQQTEIDDNFLPKVELNKLSEDQAFLMVDQLRSLYVQENIILLEDAADINPEFVYSVNAGDDFEITFLGQEPFFSTIEFIQPDTYYLAVSDGSKLIGYGYITKNRIEDDQELVIAFRILEPYRHQTEKISARIFKSLLAGGREIFGKNINQFFLPAHQINGKYGIDSGAFIFYQKLGFKLTEKYLQDLWIEQYLSRVQAGEKLSKAELLSLSQSNMRLDLYQVNDLPDFKSPRVLILPQSSVRETLFLDQSV